MTSMYTYLAYTDDIAVDFVYVDFVYLAICLETHSHAAYFKVTQP